MKEKKTVGYLAAVFGGLSFGAILLFLLL